MEVRVENGEVDKALKQLKKKMQREGIFKVLKQRRFYEKPSERKKRKKKEAKRKAKT